MTYYDRIAWQWHTATGHSGGAFKRFVLNDVLIKCIGDIDDSAILELAAGNGYFLPLLLRARSGQIPRRIVVTDSSAALLRIAEGEFQVASAIYQQLDVRSGFPFSTKSFDLVIAVMLFNELSDGAVRRALSECSRVLTDSGRLVGAVIHSDFVTSLNRRGELHKDEWGKITMPGSDGLRLPLVPRSQKRYEGLFREAGFELRSTALRPTEVVLQVKPGLRHLGTSPIALAFEAHISDTTEKSA